MTAFRCRWTPPVSTQLPAVLISLWCSLTSSLESVSLNSMATQVRVYTCTCTQYVFYMCSHCACIRLCLYMCFDYISDNIALCSTCTYMYLYMKLLLYSFTSAEIVTQIAFSQDCKYLYTVSGDSCIFVWRLSREITQVR